jgi:hypothetical protein
VFIFERMGEHEIMSVTPPPSSPADRTPAAAAVIERALRQLGLAIVIV